MKKTLLTLLFFAVAAGSSAKERIISQSPFITYTLQYLGVDDHIVGVSRYDFLDLPKTGGIIDPDGEAIARLEPDIIFTSDWTDPKVLHAVTPENGEAVILHGFKGMGEVEESIIEISQVLGIPDGKRRAAEFSAEWRRAATEVHGEGARTLILSSCAGSPFSFGRKTYIYELFTAAGFNVVENHGTIRHMKKSEEIESVAELVRLTRPDVIFVLHDSAHGCAVPLKGAECRVVELNGEHFVYPSPRLLEGLNDLKKWKSL